MINVNVSQPYIKSDLRYKEAKVDNSNLKVVKGDTGATFTPYVDELSNISWTNDGGLPNPPVRNIRGKDSTVQPITNFDIEKMMEG